MSEGQQVGSATIDGVFHASLWSGSAESWVDLHPAGASSSFALAVHAGYQVGSVNHGGLVHASVWSGTVESRVDLHAFLPAEFTGSSWANGVWTDGVYLYVVGDSVNSTTNRSEALLWTRPLCPADFDGDGFITGLDYDLYVQAFEGGDVSADFDGDGFITGVDFDLYVQAFETGC